MLRQTGTLSVWAMFVEVVILSSQLPQSGKGHVPPAQISAGGQNDWLALAALALVSGRS